MIALGGFVATYFGFVLKLMATDAETNRQVGLTNERVAAIEGKMVLCDEHTKVLGCLPEMQADLATLTEQGKVFWEVIAPKLRDIIHSPHCAGPGGRDELIDLLVADKITTLRQTRTLEAELEKLWAESQNPADQVAAMVFLAQTRWIRHKLERRCAERRKNRPSTPEGGSCSTSSLKI